MSQLINTKFLRYRRSSRRRDCHNPWQRMDVTEIGYPFRGAEKAVANPGDSLYKFWMFGRVFECLPQFFHRGINRMLKVNKCALRPEGSPQLLAGDNSSLRLQKQPQQLEWLVLNWHTHARTEQLSAPQIHMERVKAYRRPRERTVCSQLTLLLSSGECTSIRRNSPILDFQCIANYPIP